MEAASPIITSDWRDAARVRLPREIFDYVDGGAGSEHTQRANRCDLDMIGLAPLVMRDVSVPDLGTTLLGLRIPLPIGFSPTGLHRLVHPEGETATARAAATLDVPMTVSAMASVAIEEIARRSGHRQLWLQTYLFKDRSVAPRLVARAEAAGCAAVVVTAGCPVMGYRDRNLRNRFVLPADVMPAHFKRLASTDHNNPLSSFAGAEIDDGATWADLARLCAGTRLPVFIKGVMTAADVEPALNAGVSGIIVSNHGGRQLDGGVSTISVLPRVAAALRGRAMLLIDSGFERGTDVLKALALGADAVMLGRSVLWALAVAGEEGVRAMIGQFVDELRTALQLTGCATFADLRSYSNTIVRVPPAWE